jgi:hypothetical protein
MRNVSRELGRTAFKPGNVILGGLAHTLSLENHAQPVAIWGRQEARRVFNQDPIRKYHPDYLVILKEIDGLPWGYEERYYRYVSPERKIRTIKLLPDGKGSHRVIAELYKAPEHEPNHVRISTACPSDNS